MADAVPLGLADPIRVVEQFFDERFVELVDGQDMRELHQDLQRPVLPGRKTGAGNRDRKTGPERRDGARAFAA
jgi:hypothetical protein